MVLLFFFLMILGAQYSYVYGSCYRAYQYIVKDLAAEEREYAVDISNKIPKTERDRVFGYDISIGFYLNTNIFPCYKYFGCQNLHISVNPSIEKELCSFLENTPAKWLVLRTGYVDIPEELESKIRELYVPYSANPSYTLLSLKQE